MRDMENEKTMWPSDLAKQLDIKPVTLRAWSNAFEQHGFEFLKDQSGRRAYTEENAMMFTKFQELCKTMNQDNAINSVMEMIQNGVKFSDNKRYENTEITAMSEKKRYPEQFVQGLVEEVAGLREQVTALTQIVEMMAKNNHFDERLKAIEEQLQKNNEQNALIAERSEAVEQIAASNEGFQHEVVENFNNVLKKFNDHQQEILDTLDEKTKPNQIIDLGTDKKLRELIERVDDMSKSVETVIEESRADRHRKRGFFERLFGK